MAEVITPPPAIYVETLSFETTPLTEYTVFSEILICYQEVYSLMAKVNLRILE